MRRALRGFSLVLHLGKATFPPCFLFDLSVSVRSFPCNSRSSLWDNSFRLHADALSISMGSSSPTRIWGTFRPNYVPLGGSIASNLEEEMAPFDELGLSSAPVTPTITVAVVPVCPCPFGELLFHTRLKCIAPTPGDTSSRTEFRRFPPKHPRVGNEIRVTLGTPDGVISRLLLRPNRRRLGIATYPPCAFIRRAGTSDALKEWSLI